MKTEQRFQPRTSRILRAFTDHPASVNETYIEHALFAGRFAVLLLAAAGAALIHAVIPPLFQTTASKIITKLNAQMQARH
ncbi:MAG: DUF6356 family protein [Roseobacter sp.]